MANRHHKRVKHAKAQVAKPERAFKRRVKFNGFKDLAQYAKGAVYLIVRIRPVDESPYRVLGTGFLAAENRLITCNHCINSDASTDPVSQHQDGDMYLFIQRDEDGAFHRYGLADVKLSDNLFLYPDYDIAVFELPDDFYMVDGEKVKEPAMYLELSTTPYDIGTDTAILGYPLPELAFEADGTPDLTNVHIRGDKGVVNTRYIKEEIEVYEFTTPFNPGNSGGPILNTQTGEVIGMVFAYNAVPINYTIDTIPVGAVGNEEEMSVASVIRTTYSIGVSSRNYADIITRHGIAVRK